MLWALSFFFATNISLLSIIKTRYAVVLLHKPLQHLKTNGIDDALKPLITQVRMVNLKTLPEHIENTIHALKLTLNKLLALCILISLPIPPGSDILWCIRQLLKLLL